MDGEEFSRRIDKALKGEYTPSESSMELALYCVENEMSVTGAISADLRDSFTVAKELDPIYRLGLDSREAMKAFRDPPRRQKESVA